MSNWIEHEIDNTWDSEFQIKEIQEYEINHYILMVLFKTRTKYFKIYQ